MRNFSCVLRWNKMNGIILVSFVCLLTVFSHNDNDGNRALFNSFQLKFGKSYNQAEEEKRFAIFIENLDEIRSLNQKNYPDASFAINKFSDLSKDEFRDLISCTGQIQSYKQEERKTIVENFNEPYPDIDWIEKGAVSSIKNQGHCGSCYAFSAIGQMEGLSYIKGGKLQEFSVQQIVDCGGQVKPVTHGCNGGWPQHVLNYASVKGMETWTDYPYVGVEQTCAYNQSKTVQKFSFAKQLFTEEAFIPAIMDAPISVCVDATFLMHYDKGVISGKQNCQWREINHCILLVGSNSTEGWWRFKNSWGTDHGELGYVRMHHGDRFGNQGFIGKWENTN